MQELRNLYDSEIYAKFKEGLEAKNRGLQTVLECDNVGDLREELDQYGIIGFDKNAFIKTVEKIPQSKLYQLKNQSVGT